MSASAVESLQEVDGKMVSSFLTKSHYAQNRSGFWGNNGHCSAYIAIEEGLQWLQFSLSKNSVLHPHSLWTVGPFTTFEFAEFHVILCFCLNLWMLSTHLFCFTASKVLGSNRERGAWNLSAVPFPFSCYSFSLVHLQNQQCPVQQSSSPQSLIFVIHHTRRASKIFPGA